MRYYASLLSSSELEIYEIGSISGSRVNVHRVPKQDFIDDLSMLIDRKAVKSFQFDAHKLRIKWFRYDNTYHEFDDEYVFRNYDEGFFAQIKELESAFDVKPVVNLNASAYEKEKYNNAAYRLLNEYIKSKRINPGSYDLASLVDYIRVNFDKIEKPPISLSLKNLTLKDWLRLVCYAGTFATVGACITFPLAGTMIPHIVATVLATIGVRRFLDKKKSEICIQSLDKLTDIAIKRNEQANPEKALDLAKVYDWVNKDIIYINGHFEYATTEALEDLRNLLTNKPAVNENVSRVFYVKELIDIEKRIFDRETRTGKKDEACVFNWDTLGERLEYLGFDILAFESDSFWSTLYETVVTLNEHPFYGDESALLDLFEVAVEYALQRANFESLEDFQKSFAFKSLSQRRKAAETFAINKMNATYKLANLTEVLNELEKTLRKDATMQPDREKLEIPEAGRRIGFSKQEGQVSTHN